MIFFKYNEENIWVVLDDENYCWLNSKGVKSFFPDLIPITLPKVWEDFNIAPKHQSSIPRDESLNSSKLVETQSAEDENSESEDESEIPYEEDEPLNSTQLLK
ncbi:hypothetical protein CDAR_232061 [Caerostris darwini]|uniref:Uncharacterized protein n=1 Tax=Caerostris darwini TaxID=1538125 RepID=A0AAV4P5X8_9ARAC|nr:hypothetical protein CDAR_232061 [Caerostris darwini]